jgi:hypothetical protein
MIKEKQIISDSLDEYHASHRSPAIVNHNGNDREIGRVFTEYCNNLVIIAGENKKDHVYLIPKTKVNNYDERKIYLNISEDSLKEFEI